MMTSPQSPDGRPLTRRELRERLERARQQAAERAAAAAPEAAPSEAPAADDAKTTALPTAAPASEASATPSPAADPAREASPGAAAEPRTRPIQGAPRRRPTPPSTPPADEGQGHDAALHDLLSADEQPAPRQKKRRGGAIVVIVIILALIAALIGGGVWAVKTYGGPVADFLGINSEPTDYEEGLATGEAVITIAEGDTGWEVSQKLHEEDVTLTESVFYDMLVSAQLNPDFRPGVYQLQQKMTAKAALTALKDPENRLEDGVAYPEGYTVEQIVPILVNGLDASEDEVREALADPSQYGVGADTLEGWLFPATYTFEPGTAPADAVQEMVDRTRESLASAGVPDDEAQRVLTIASIIEREARSEDDFYRVSRVIQNRLDDDMRLQMDSTAQYGYGEMHDGDVYSSEQALNDDNAWNTYVHTGLPAGPISNPGDTAIDAAMHPADGDWLYFVTVDLNTGETKFAATLDEHERYVAELQEWCQANPDSGC